MPSPQNLAEHIDRLLTIETAADEIHAWHPALVPGILQTEAYAAAAIGASAPSLSEDMIELRAWQRARRIDTLGLAPGRQARVVVAEAALRRPVGGRDVLVTQLHHLLDVMALRPSLELRVLPARADDQHPALVGAFSIYTAGGARSVFLESLHGGTVLDVPERTLPYTYAWDHADRQAVDCATSRRMILETRRRLVARR